MKVTGERLFLDSSAWLSYFLAENDLSRKFIEGGRYLIMTSVLSIFEIKRKMLMRNAKEPKIEGFLDFIKRDKNIIFSDKENIRKSSVFNALMQDYFSKPPQEKAENEYNKVKSKIKALASNPLPIGIKKLSEKVHRIRIGNYRVIYSIFDKEKLIIIAAVKKRAEDTYK